MNKMGRRDGGFSGERNAVSALLSDALLFITMYIIGEPVDVHVKDGSVYAGIFYTASAEENYAIVLKNAMRTKKGNREVNIEDGSLVDTLVVQGEDIVQVVAKGVSISENGIFAVDNNATSGKHNQSSVDKQIANVTRQTGDGLGVKQTDDGKKTEFQGAEIVGPSHSSSSDKTKRKLMPGGRPSHAQSSASIRLDDQSFLKHASEKSPYLNAALDVATTSNHVNHSINNRLAKDSRLNPQANLFTPTPYRHVLVVPAIPVEIPSIGYFLDPSLMMTADPIQPEYDVTGHAGGGIQPASFAMPYHYEAAPAYIHQNTENTMAGQMALPVYLPPLAHDAISASGQLSMSPMLAHYQVLPTRQDHFNQPRQT